ncbi:MULTISPECIES: hypothetical protein [unclassified Streptomyces]|uniref:hypothetical protein n=1 Tax=unclassified Streptomyces TaxID=2593676 RepID=UPI000F6D3997|nr:MULTISPECIES: hypothetical protein [unclassified Streptomyces]AZM62048.1 hypothetical protein DLM49_23160 [Streptomyces sp. WAC 01438]RSM97364.1 hypothetical protein DMA10_11720 [Streptomyces sp. WAC 01420]
MEASWYSQPYPPEGASAAEGIRNQLGRPELDLLTILVRESAQNSWDARLPDSSTPVDYGIDMWSVGPAHAGAWRTLLTAGSPTNPDHFPLRNTLRHPVIRVLAVSDRGTRGLGGPSRANDAVGADRDFVSFVRNIGEPRDKALGGGTYGFGKGIFYLLAKSGSVLVHSRCRTADGGYETRLIGCTLWKSYVATERGGDRRYTGRHWWGDISGDVVEPLVGTAADAAAQRLGLRSFGPRETGTTVVVIDPNLDEFEQPTDAAEYLAETITWHLWPKMISTDSEPPAMRFSVTCDGVPYEVPDPRTTSPLHMFVKAYEVMKSGQGRDLACLKPKKHLGRLGLDKRIMPALEESRAKDLLGIEDVVHHVCLMRPAELVVTYRPGPKPPSIHQGYAGVFRADESMDEVYAKAEPPTHDAWNSQSLERPESTYVHTTFTRIGEALNGLLSLNGNAGQGASSVALGAASSYFSGLVGGAWGIGGATDYSKPGSTVTRSTDADDDTGGRGRRTTGKGKASGGSTVGGGDGDDAGAPHGAGDSTPRRRPRVQYVGDPYYEDHGESTLLVQEFRLPVTGPQRVRSDLAVTLPGTGGRETDPPLGATMPVLVGWQDESGRMHDGDPCVVEGSDALWRALVRPAPDTMTEIGIKVEAVKEP